MDVSQFVTPGFTPEFIEVLRILETQDTEVKQKRSFRRFVRDYGNALNIIINTAYTWLILIIESSI